MNLARRQFLFGVPALPLASRFAKASDLSSDIAVIGAGVGGVAAALAALRAGLRVGIGCYRIDLHPSRGGTNYIDISSLPFQIPLGALLPRRIENLLPACKNIGTTHVTETKTHPIAAPP
jgi:thioredoxin reductase